MSPLGVIGYSQQAFTVKNARASHDTGNKIAFTNVSQMFTNPSLMVTPVQRQAGTAENTSSNSQTNHLLFAASQQRYSQQRQERFSDHRSQRRSSQTSSMITQTAVRPNLQRVVDSYMQGVGVGRTNDMASFWAGITKMAVKNEMLSQGQDRSADTTIIGTTRNASADQRTSTSHQRGQGKIGSEMHGQNEERKRMETAQQNRTANFQYN